MMHRSIRAFTIALIVAAVPVSLAAQSVARGWEPAIPGTLLSVVYEERVTPQQIASEGVRLFEDYPMPVPVYAADVYRLTFWSSDHDGTPIRVAASLYVPVSLEPIRAPVLAFGSGTTGVGDHCAPSLENPAVVRLGWYRANMLAYAGQGVISIFPDYTGFNDTTVPQRYFSKFAEGYLMLDSIRAAKAVASSVETLLRTRALPATESFTAGYSQGGHAALAAADLLTEYAPEIELAGAIGFGSTNNVEMLFREAGYYPPHIVYTYMQLYGDRVVEPETILQPRWLATLEFDVLTKCVTEFQRYYPFNVRGLYTERFYDALMERRLDEEFPAFKRILDENESGLTGHGVPVLLVQGNQDLIVTNAAQREYAERLSATGVDVELLELEGVLHRQTRPAGFVRSVDFIQEHVRP